MIDVNNSMSTNMLLQQMRMMSTQAQSPVQGNNVSLSGVQQEGGSFPTQLKAAVDKVNDAHQLSKELKVAYQFADPDVTLVDVMLASQKSGLSFQAMLQVRNKLVIAYQDIMNMPV